MNDPEAKLEPGTKLDERYELVEEIARGGFGLVYRARQLNMDRQVAIKLVPPKFMDLPDVVQRFEREARLASRLNHPNTITVHDYGKHEDYLFLVMELLEGEDLADQLARDRTVALSRIGEISRQILKSLHEAHQHGIIHRDLKPENIFLTEISGESDFVKVVDFGIAKLAMPEMDQSADGSKKLTIEGNTVGTPTYMSPEQAAGGTIDARSDLYGLGVMMYEMAAGEPPFDAEDPAKLMREHIFKEVPELPEERLRNSWLQPIVRRALAKEKDDRYQDASSFIDAIDYAIEASNDNRAFAATDEHTTVDEQDSDEREEKAGEDDSTREESREVVADTSSDEHAAQDPVAAAPVTPTDSPQLEATTEGADSAAIRAPSEDQNSDSSIMTVLEESSDDDVIVLDEPKESNTEPERRAGPGPPSGGVDRVPDSDARPPRQTTGDAQSAPDRGRERPPSDTSTEFADQSTELGPADERSPRTANGAEREGADQDSNSWSWSGDPETQEIDASRSGHNTSVRRTRSWTPVIIVILLLVASAVAAYAYVNGLLP